MNRAFVHFVLVSSLWQMTSSFPADDEIVGLPGLKFQPNFKHYSGTAVLFEVFYHPDQFLAVK